MIKKICITLAYSFCCSVFLFSENAVKTDELPNNVENVTIESSTSSTEGKKESPVTNEIETKEGSNEIETKEGSNEIETKEGSNEIETKEGSNDKVQAATIAIKSAEKLDDIVGRIKFKPFPELITKYLDHLKAIAPEKHNEFSLLINFAIGGFGLLNNDSPLSIFLLSNVKAPSPKIDFIGVVKLDKKNKNKAKAVESMIESLGLETKMVDKHVDERVDKWLLFGRQGIFEKISDKQKLISDAQIRPKEDISINLDSALWQLNNVKDLICGDDLVQFDAVKTITDDLERVSFLFNSTKDELSYELNLFAKQNTDLSNFLSKPNEPSFKNIECLPKGISTYFLNLNLKALNVYLSEKLLKIEKQYTEKKVKLDSMESFISGSKKFLNEEKSFTKNWNGSSVVRILPFNKDVTLNGSGICYGSWDDAELINVLKNYSLPLMDKLLEKFRECYTCANNFYLKSNLDECVFKINKGCVHKYSLLAEVREENAKTINVSSNTADSAKKAKDLSVQNSKSDKPTEVITKKVHYANYVTVVKNNIVCANDPEVLKELANNIFKAKPNTYKFPKNCIFKVVQNNDGYDGKGNSCDVDVFKVVQEDNKLSFKFFVPIRLIKESFKFFKSESAQDLLTLLDGSGDVSTEKKLSPVPSEAKQEKEKSKAR